MIRVTCEQYASFDFFYDSSLHVVKAIRKLGSISHDFFLRGFNP